MRMSWQSVKRALFENRSHRQTIIKNTFWLTGSNLLGRLIRAGLIIYVARVLGAEGYGVFSYALSIAAFFSVFSDIGVSAILTREGSRNPEALPKYLGTSLAIKTTLLLISDILILVVAPFFTNIPKAVPLLPVAALLLSFDGLREFAFSITRAKEKMEVEAGIGIFTNIAITAIGVAAVFVRPTPTVLMVGYTLGSGLGMLLAYLLLRTYFSPGSLRFDLTLVGPILKEALPFSLSVVLGTVLLSTDTVMLGWLANAREVGLYAAAQRPVQLLYVLPGILGSVLFPAFARFVSTDRSRFRALFEQGIAALFLASIPLAIGGMIVSGNLTLLLFGSGYAAAAVPFALLLGTLFAVFPLALFGNAVFAYGRQQEFVKFMVAGAVTNVILDLILIPRYGGIGCAIATLVAEGIVVTLNWYRFNAIAPFTVLPHLQRIIPAAAIMGIATFLLDRAGVPVLVTVGVGGLIYGGILYALREPLLERFHPWLVARPRGTKA